MPRSATFFFFLTSKLVLFSTGLWKSVHSTGHSPVLEVVNVLHVEPFTSEKTIWLYKFVVFLSPNSSIFSYKIPNCPNVGITFWYQITLAAGILHDFFVKTFVL